MPRFSLKNLKPNGLKNISIHRSTFILTNKNVTRYIPSLPSHKGFIIPELSTQFRGPKSLLLRVSHPFGHVVMRDIPAAHNYPDDGIRGQPGCGRNDCGYKRPGGEFNP